MKILIRLLIVLAALVILIIALAFGCVYLLESMGPGIAAGRIKAMTGFRLDVASLKLSILNGSLRIDDATLRNPEGWPEESFLTVNSAVIDVEPGTMLGDGQKVIDELVLDMGPINVVTNKDGKTNVSLLTSAGKSEEEEAAEGSEKEKKQQETSAGKTTKVEFLIRHLVLRTNSIRYANYSTGGTPIVQEIPVKYSIEMENVTDLKQVQEKVMSQLKTSFLDKMLKSTKWSKILGNGDDEK